MWVDSTLGDGSEITRVASSGRASFLNRFVRMGRLDVGWRWVAIHRGGLRVVVQGLR